MAPADQRLGTDHLLAPDIDLRLELQEHFAAPDCGVQVMEKRERVLLPLLPEVAQRHHAVARLPNRSFGKFDHSDRIACAAFGHRRADAHLHRAEFIADQDRRRQLLAKPVKQRRDVRVACRRPRDLDAIAPERPGAQR